MKEWKASCWPCLSCLCLCPIQTSCWYNPCALPRQPVVFYDETRWDLERDLSRGEKKDGFFFSSDTPVEELQCPIFISEEKLRGAWVMDWQQMLFYCPWCTLCVHFAPSLWWFSPRLSDTFSCLPVDHCIYLSVLFQVTLSFSLSPCYFVLQSLWLSEAEEVQSNSLVFDYWLLTLIIDAMFFSLASATHAHDLSICYFEVPLSSFVFLL